MKVRFILCKDKNVLYRDIELEFIPPIGYEAQIKFEGQNKIIVCKVIHGMLYIDNSIINETFDKVIGREGIMVVCNVEYKGEFNG